MEAPCNSRFDGSNDGETHSLGASLPDGGCSPYDHAVQDEAQHRVEAALRRVPEAFRTVVVLREIEGFTYEEIADILQVNLGTVKSRLTRGRAALRAQLAPPPAASETRAPKRPCVRAGSLASAPVVAGMEALR